MILPLCPCPSSLYPLSSLVLPLSLWHGMECPSGSDTLAGVYKVLNLLQEAQNKYLKLLFPPDISNIDGYLIVPWDCIQEKLNTFCLLFYRTSPENKHYLVLLKETFWRQLKGCVCCCGLWILCLEPVCFSFDNPISSMGLFFVGSS